MLWGKGNRFATKELLTTGPDPAVDHGGGPPSSPTLVNFTDYLRKQLVQSKQYFKASSVWSDHESEIPLPKPAPVNVLEKPSNAKKAAGKEKSRKKGKHKRAARPVHEAQVHSNVAPAASAQRELPTPTVTEEEVDSPTLGIKTTELLCDDDLLQTLENLRIADPRPEDGMDDKQVIVHSPPKVKPIRIMKKKIYTSQYIPINDIPGPGTYNIAGSLIKPSFNRVYSEPPPALPETSGPNYLRHTTTSHCRNADFPTNYIPEKESIVWESPTKQLMMYSIKAFKTKASGGSRATAACKTSPHGKPTAPFNAQYPPVSNKSILRWSSEAQLSYSHGLKGHSQLEHSRGRVKQNVVSF